MKRKKIRSGWVEYFNFSARERRGAGVLAIIIFLQIAFLVWNKVHQEPFPLPDPELIAAVKNLQSSLAIRKDSLREAVEEITIKPFDPNKLTVDNAVLSGLSEKQAKVIVNYISKGGMFRTKKDFGKMYCISENQFEKLKPYLLLPDSLSFVKPSTGKLISKPRSFRVDIGMADSIALTDIRGIGPVLASRIVKYREKLGGFVSTAQLKEVFGIRDSLYTALLPFIVLSDTIPFRFIHINSDSLNVLASHPYIRWKLSNMIFNYRKQHSFNTTSDIKQIPIVTDEIYNKLIPYIKID